MSDDVLVDEIAVVTAKVQSIFDLHDTRTAAAVMLGHSARAIRALIAAGLWTPENVKQMMDDVQREVLTPQKEKPEIQYVMDGEPIGRPN